MAKKKITILDLYPSRITITEAGCWLWNKLNKKGYPARTISYRSEVITPHRLSCLLNGKKIEGLEVDHLCRVRACVNPKHLEPVTHAENIKRSPFSRKIACKHGHIFTKENTRVAINHGRKARFCLTCERLHGARRTKEHGKEISANKKIYYSKNREKILAYKRAYYREHGKKSHIS